MTKPLYAILTLFIACCFSCGNVKSETANQNNATLWKISGNGLKDPSYLFGSLHITCDSIEMDSELLKAIQKTKQLYFELDTKDPEISQIMKQERNMKGDTTISSLTSREDFAMLNTFLIETMGFSAIETDSLKPEILNMMLTSKIMDCKDVYSYEEEILKVAKKQNIKMHGLESIREQMIMYDSIPYSIQVKGLLESARTNLTANKKRLKEMNTHYANKDIEGSAKFITESENETYSKYSHIILDNRNIKWIPKIENAAGQMPTFFVVGVSHLAGKKGIINLLRERGFTVEAVN